MNAVDRAERIRWTQLVRENPDDDEVRLRCAKWYASLGTAEHIARADFILLQIERGRLAHDDPRHGELYAQELRLLAQYGKQWRAAHPGLRRGIFRRGFVEYAHLHLQEFLSYRRELLALEPVRDVRFTGFYRAKPELVVMVARCRELRFLDSVRLHHQGPHKSPDDRAVQLLESPHFTQLKSLYTTWCGFSEEGTERFKALPFLKELTTLELPVVHYGDFGSSDHRLALEKSASLVREWKCLKKFLCYQELSSAEWMLVARTAGWRSLSWLRLSRAWQTLTDTELEELLPLSLKEVSVEQEENSRALHRLLERLSQCSLGALTLPDTSDLSRQQIEEALRGASWKLEHLDTSDANLIAATSALGLLRNVHSLRGHLEPPQLEALLSARMEEGSLVRLKGIYSDNSEEQVCAFLRSPVARGLVSLSLGFSLTENIISALRELPLLSHFSGEYRVDRVAPSSIAALRARIPWWRVDPVQPPRDDDEEEETWADRKDERRAWYRSANNDNFPPLDGFVEHIYEGQARVLSL